MKLNKMWVIGYCLLLTAGFAAATSSTTIVSAATAVCKVLENIQALLWSIAGGLAVVVITLQGIKWTGSAEDPGARKSAKMGVIHAVVGLIIVLLATWIVAVVFPFGSCKNWLST
jgi:hypothetical protein